MTRRVGRTLVFGEGTERWSFPDPGHPTVEEAQHSVRYGGDEGKTSGALVLAEVASAVHYLVHTCPTTRLACAKLAEIRRAARAVCEP